MFYVSLLLKTYDRITARSQIRPISFRINSSVVTSAFFLSDLSLFVPRAGSKGRLFAVRTIKGKGKRCISLFSVTVGRTRGGLLLLACPSRVLCCSLRNACLSSCPLSSVCRSFTISGKFVCLQGSACTGKIMSSCSLVIVGGRANGRASLLRPLCRATPFYSSNGCRVAGATSILFAHGFSGRVCQVAKRSVRPLCVMS